MHLTGRIGLATGLFTASGPKPHNEDCLGVHIPPVTLLPTKGIVACIADGVSAASAGKEAAESAVIGFITDYYETPEAWEVKTAGQRVLTALNRWLFSQGQGFRAAEGVGLGVPIDICGRPRIASRRVSTASGGRWRGATSR